MGVRDPRKAILTAMGDPKYVTAATDFLFSSASQGIREMTTAPEGLRESVGQFGAS